MTWEELEAADPVDLLTMSPDFVCQFPPLEVDQTLTIGMAAYGNIQTTLFALRAVLASVSGDFELILVDDASPDETGKLFELVSRVHRNTKVFRFQQNLEYSGSLNTILSHASGDNILFVSNDIFITPAYVRQILGVAAHEPDAGLVRGCSNFVDNGLPLHTIKDCGDLDSFPSLFDYSQQRADAFNLCCHDDPFLTGDLFLVTRRLLKRVGFLDPRFYGYFADHDLGLRARRAGFRPRLALGAFAWHQHGSNMDYLKAADKEKKLKARWAKVNENWARFKAKYDLPVHLPYQGMRRIPWDGLSTSLEAENASLYPPCDHRRFIVPSDPDSPEWRRYRATELAKRARLCVNSARLRDAIKLCRAALEADPENSDVLAVLGSAYVYRGQLTEGIRIFRRAVKLSSASAKVHSNLLLAMNYSDACSQQMIYSESRRWEALHIPTKTTIAAVMPARRSRIRIAYLSPDLRSHSVCYFFSPLLKHHDRANYEIYSLSDALHTDSVTDRLMALCDGWRDISRLDTESVAKVIREIQPDIVVDLAGHTGHTIRLPLFSERLAPVQVTWLGYPNTTGIGAVDYRLTDALADPPGSSDTVHYSEFLYRLPGAFLCYEPPEKAPAVAPLPMKRNGHVTFGSFNMLPKITDVVISVWSRILKQIPGSRLVLKNHYFRDRTTVRRTLRRFENNGIENERLDLFPTDPDLPTHLSKYGLIDVALDTFPYNGTTTTCEALWMGVPVVTMSGDRHSARVGASLLMAVQLDDCVAEAVDGYVSTAIRLSSSMTGLEKIRSDLRERMRRSLLCDAAGFARRMETFYGDALRKFPRYNE